MKMKLTTEDRRPIMIPMDGHKLSLNGHTLSSNLTRHQYLNIWIHTIIYCFCVIFFVLLMFLFFTTNYFNHRKFPIGTVEKNVNTTDTVFNSKIQSHKLNLRNSIWNADQVLSLPGLDIDIGFNHYSGYLKSINGSYLYYWFFESQNDPETDPVVLWLNGGPGCSSLLGALTENGPFKVNKKRNLSLNPYAWNTRASILYIESPAGVGFSYNEHENYVTNDHQTAEQNMAAVRSFFEKFAHYSMNDFYVTGESYAGIYVPMLAELMVRQRFPKNLKGFAIGNGFLDYDFNLISVPYYYYYHGLIDRPKWQSCIHSCCENFTENQICNFTANIDSPECMRSIDMIMNLEEISMNLNQYNIYDNCKRSIQIGQCLDSDDLEAYLNEPQVKRALHVDNQHNVQPWTNCNENIFNNYQYELRSVRQQFEYLIQNGLKALIYNGDLDAVCNFLGAQWFIDSLPLESTGANYSQWLYGGQIGGFRKSFHNLTIATVRGAGHMVPSDKPGPAQQLFYYFLDN